MKFELEIAAIIINSLENNVKAIEGLVKLEFELEFEVHATADAAPRSAAQLWRQGLSASTGASGSRTEPVPQGTGLLWALRCAHLY